jgi:hypothetical protein
MLGVSNAKVMPRQLPAMHTMKSEERRRTESDNRAVAIYHVVYEHEGFEKSAQVLLKLVQQAEEMRPGKKRSLYLDIEGHRNHEGGFDADMSELRKEFLLSFLSRYLSEIHAPLVNARNPHPQNNEIPSTLAIQYKGAGVI